MSRALGIPEIVRMVLALCNHQSTLARSARVCRMWKEPALDILWREVYDPRNLLAILSPLKRVSICDHVGSSSDDREQWEGFSVIPSSQEWDHFMTYSRRVKNMALTGNSVPFSEELMLHVSLAKKNHLLPNLEALAWRDPQYPSSLFFSVAFMPPSLRYLQVAIINSDFPISCIPSFLDLVRVCAPSLVELELLISWRYAPEHYTGALVKLLQCLPHLQAVKLSPMAFTPKVSETLTKLPHLERLGYHHSDDYARNFFHPTLAPPSLGMRVGSFPNLVVLAAPLSSVRDFVLGSGRLESIYSLEIQARSHRDNIKEIFHALPLVFPNLSILKLRFCQRANAINMDILQPLFDIPQIKEFYLSDDDMACHLSDSDVEEMSSKWPMLEVLHLNEDHPYTNISLSALIPLARNCRRLYRVGLSINREIPVLNGTPTPFARLETLCVGQSSATNPAKIAAFLSQLCRGPLHIQGRTYLLWNLTSNFLDEEHLRNPSCYNTTLWRQWETVEAIHEELRLARVKVLEGLGETGMHFATRKL